MIPPAGAARYRDVPVLVAGATGFIGRAVAAKLSRAGARLVLPCRDPDRGRDLFSRLGIRGRIIAWDATDTNSVREAVHLSDPALVLNLVGYGVSRDERDPGPARALNARLPASLLRALAERDPPPEPAGWEGARLIHAGSALEYGAVGGDLDEAIPGRPETLYGRTKLEGTLELARAARDRDVECLTARLFTVYGPGEREGRLLPTLLRAVGGDEPIPLSEGSQRRDFTYVEDVAEGLLRLASGDTGGHRIVNLATGRLTTVREFVTIAARVLEIEEARLRWGALPPRPEEMSHDPVTIRRLRELTGWAPDTGIADGVRRAFEAMTGSTGRPGEGGC